MKKIHCRQKTMGAMVLGFLTLSTSLQAQTTTQELTTLILQKDSLFWTGYNRCDTALNGQFLADDLEFYHDKGGITNGKQALQASLKNNLCSRPNWRLRREAIAGTVKLFPLHKNDTIYGAILSGDHYFYITEAGKPEFRSGRASFTHLWLKQNGVWKMTRILSYDHHAAELPAKDKKAITLPPAVLKQYVGRYKGPQSDSVFIREEMGTLVLLSRNSKMVLYPETPTTFFAKERDLGFEFLHDDRKRTTGLRVKEHGAIVEELVRAK